MAVGVLSVGVGLIPRLANRADGLVRLGNCDAMMSTLQCLCEGQHERRGNFMRKFVSMTVLGAMLLILSTATAIHAAFTAVPEIDPTNGLAAAALLTGALLVIRGRIKK